ncbi:MAG TPA: hypothetical protein VGD65_25360 [Chryseosolibacter sp.]
MLKKERIPIIFFALLSLVCGLWTGLTRIGWDARAFALSAHHGAIMVSAFLGTLITLEKIIPLRNKFLYAIPVINASSVAVFFIGQPRVACYITVASSLALSVVFLHYLNKQRSLVYLLMLAGSVCWLVGNILILTKSFYPLAFPWWASFALFVISAERMELMQFLPVATLHKSSFVSLLGMFLIGCFFSFHGAGNLFCGFALIGISLWLMRFDITAVNLKKSGLPQFVAVALLAAYAALLFTGVFFISLPNQWLSYDAIVHSFFLGFVFSMIFAHGPIILPNVLGIRVTHFSPLAYGWLAILHLSWMVRIFGDITVHLVARKVSGAMSAVAIIGYFITLAIVIVRSHRHVKVV